MSKNSTKHTKPDRLSDIDIELLLSENKRLKHELNLASGQIERLTKQNKELQATIMGEK